MKLKLKSSTHIAASIFSAFLATPHAWAQGATLAVPQTNTAEAIQAGINPMTGRPLSEEELQRQLSKSKLLTQIGQEQVKQAQNAADLALGNLRVETEKNRARAESMAQLSASGNGKSVGVTLIKPMPLPPTNTSSSQSSRAAPTGPQSPAWVQTMPTTPQSAAKASGTIRIGDETLDVSSNVPLTAPAQVQWVDSQVRQVARAGSPLQPINVQPATGVLGIPAIPGITPAMTPPSQPQ
jgi:hypothetical protein